MSEILLSSIITVIATLITTLIINGFNFWQKKIELSNRLAEMEKEFENSKVTKDIEFKNNQLANDKQLLITTFQDFAALSGRTVSLVDSRKIDDPPIDLKIIAEFDNCFYKAYLFLKSEEDRQKFIHFRNSLSKEAGYKHPEGITIFDDEIEAATFDPEYIEPPHYIFDLLNNCLIISSKYIESLLFHEVNN